MLTFAPLLTSDIVKRGLMLTAQLTVLASGAAAQSQSFPDFTGFHNTPSINNQGSSNPFSQLVETPNGYFGNVLLMGSVDNQGLHFILRQSTDGQNWGVIPDVYPILPGGSITGLLVPLCRGDYPNGCGYGMGSWNGTTYLAFSDQNFHLAVYSLTPVQGINDYYANHLFTDTSVYITSAPSLVVTPNNTLLIRYGTRNSSSLKNVTYVTENKGSGFFTHATTAFSPTQCAMVSFKGSVYAFDGQNNSHNGVWESQLDQDGNIIANTPHQINGWYTKSGLSAVVFNNNIDVAFQQDSSAHHFWIASSPDGINWGLKQYPNTLNFTPSLGLFNGALAAATVANDSSYSLWSDYTAY